MTNPGIIGLNSPDRLTQLRNPNGASYGSTPYYDPSTGQWLHRVGPKYDAARGIYNLNENSFPKWNLAYANQRAGTTQAKCLILGDSIFAGSAATGEKWSTGVGGRIRAFLDTKTGTVSGSGWVKASTDAQQANAGFQPTTTFGMSVATTGFGHNTGYGPENSLMFSATATNSYTVNWTGAGTMRVWWFAGVGSNASVTSTVDTVASTTITTSGAVVASSDFTVAGAGAHTLVLTIASGQFNLLGFEYITSLTAGVRTSNWGVGGVTSGQITNANSYANASVVPAMTVYAPDLTIIMYGTNDVTQWVTPSVYQTNITAAVVAAKLSGDVLLVTPPRVRVNDDPTAMAAMVKVLYSISETYNVPVLNLLNRYQTNPNSWMDSVGHPTNATAPDLAAAVMAVLNAQLPN